MPGYQPVRIVQPTDYFSKNEPIYGQTKSKKKSKGSHPLFDDLKARNMRERMEYERYLRNKEIIRTDPNAGFKYDSLKLLGSCNDITYLDNFMSMPRQRQSNATDEGNVKIRPKPLAKSSTTIFGKGGSGEKRNSIHSDSNFVTAAMMSSLRSSASEDNLYESVEMIHYLKTMQTLNRQKKTKALQKTGHPLFDSLREEQALKQPIIPHRKMSTVKKPFDDQTLQTMNRKQQDYLCSDGSSPSQSAPSSSGDEYDICPRVNAKISKGSRLKVQMQPLPERRHSDQPLNQRRAENQNVNQKKKMSDNNGSESDDEFKIIPRPKFWGRGLMMNQRQQQTQQKPRRRRSNGSSPSDESDSSFTSAVLR